MLPRWLRARLRPIILELMADVDPRSRPPCLFDDGQGHEFDPWQLTLFDCAGVSIVVQQRRCVICGYCEQTAVGDPARRPALLEATR